ncbi:MAG: hypothetical protein KF850_22275 [Labilithrix sp.]|nr:hypothetical protein [Labilithrix sp.]
MKDRRHDAPRERSEDMIPGDDPLVRALRELPTHDDGSSGRAPAAARAALVRAFDDAPLCTRAPATAGRATVPVVLASVVGLYLFWAFAAAIALNQ